MTRPASAPQQEMFTQNEMLIKLRKSGVDVDTTASASGTVPGFQQVDAEEWRADIKARMATYTKTLLE